MTGKVSVTFVITAADEANTACTDFAFALQPSVMRTCVPLISLYFLPYNGRYWESSFSHVWLKRLSHVAQVDLVKFHDPIRKGAAGLDIREVQWCWEMQLKKSSRNFCVYAYRTMLRMPPIQQWIQLTGHHLQTQKDYGISSCFVENLTSDTFWTSRSVKKSVELSLSLRYCLQNFNVSLHIYFA